MAATFDVGEFYFPGGTTGAMANDFLAARGDCAPTGPPAGTPPVVPLPPGCMLLTSGPLAGAVQEGSPTNPLPEAGNDTSRNVITINEQALLLGVVARPIDALRITADFEFGYNDQSFTRIDPRQVQSYKVHANYKPRPWANLDGAVDIHENRDNVSTVNNLEHDRSFSFSTMLMANPHLSVDFGYNYWNVYTQSEICFNFSITYSYPNPAPPPPTLTGTAFNSPPGVATTACTIPNASVGASGLGAPFHICQHGSFRARCRDLETDEKGHCRGGLWRQLCSWKHDFPEPSHAFRTLDFNYQRPYASIAIDVYRGFTYKMSWNYYGYTQTANTSPFGLAAIQSPNFNGNNATFSLRYSF